MAEKSNNYILIGMPGSGKSTIGVLLAKELDFAAVRHKMAAKQLHRGGFTASVLADYAQIITCGNIEAEVLYNRHSLIACGKIFAFYQI